MKYLFKLILKSEKALLSVVIIAIFLASILTLFQAVVAANLLNASISAGKFGASSLFSDNATHQTQLLGQILEIFKLVANEGNEAATRYVIEQQSFLLLFVLGLTVLGILSITQLILFVKDIVVLVFSTRIAMRIRSLVFSRLLYLPNIYFKREESGSIVQRLTGDASVIEGSFFSLIENGLFGPILSFFGLGLLIYLDYRLTIVIFINVIVIVLVVNFISNFIRQLVAKMARGSADINTHIYKIFSTIEAVKIFCREKWERRRYQGILGHYLKDSFRMSVLNRLIRPINEIIGLAGVVIVIFYGTVLIWNKSMDSEELFTFLFVLLYIVPYFQRMTSVSVVYAKLKVSVERVLHVVNAPNEQKFLRMGNQALEKCAGNIEFENVSFDYRAENLLSQWEISNSKNATQNSATHQESSEKPIPILRDLSFKVHAEESIAIVGESGSGKTTLVNLIAMFMKPSKGRVLFDGQPVMNFTIRSVRKQLSMVTQETFLFNVSILENVRYGRFSANLAEVKEACRLAYIDDFIESLEQGYHTVIGERGVKLSGGQKQRLAIARAILKRSRILIFDEATSALDSQSEAEVQRAIENIMNRQTTFIIAHRFSTILNVDRILVLDKGQLAEMGTHRELIAHNGIYRSLYDIQIGKQLPPSS